MFVLHVEEFLPCSRSRFGEYLLELLQAHRDRGCLNTLRLYSPQRRSTLLQHWGMICSAVHVGWHVKEALASQT
jgi:hypothetical protein